MSFIIQILTSNLQFMSHQEQSFLLSKKQTIFNHFTQKIKNSYEIAKDYLQSFIALTIVIAFFFPSFIFKIILKCLDVSYQLIKLAFKICLRVIAGIISIYLAVLRLLRFIRLADYIQKKLDFILRNAKNTKSQASTSQRQFSLNQQGLPERRQKFQQKYVINPPDIFSKKPLKAYNASTDEVQESQAGFISIFKQNKNIVPQREIIGNIVTHSHETKSPTSFVNSNEHKFGMKRHPTEPNIFFTIQQTSSNKNIKPDRDLSPQFKNDQHQPFKKSFFKSSVHQIDQNTNINPFKFSQTQTSNIEQKQKEKQKGQLQKEIDRLRKNMAQVVQKNQVQILQLQEWLTEKNLTINIERKQKIELIQKMEQLQKENKQKTLTYQLLEVNLKQIQKELMNEHFEKSNLLAKIDELEEEIKLKTIEIMDLREKIRQNYMHVQMMSNLLEQQGIQSSEINNFSVQNLDESNESSVSMEIPNNKIQQESKQTLQESSSTILSPQQSEENIQAELKAQVIEKKIDANNFNNHGTGKGNKKNKKKNKS